MNQRAILHSLPAHLRPFVAEQDYARYTARDHAVWRFLMRHLVVRLGDGAHPAYREGLRRTGIDLERIPAIDAMNERLNRFGWRAVAVDGFIPPAAFMEFQALRVLPIAQAMRRIEHILYTPAPDIVHEAAGHAPFLADADYAAFLQRFGEVGVQARTSDGDREVYLAIRRLSILKESPDAGADAIAVAERDLERALAANREPSEAARLSRLHWWTVEYGLVGRVDGYRLFGAGLLSSLGECVNCRDDRRVKKIPLSLDAIEQPYDITREQPQLFVARSFGHLRGVLEAFAGRVGRRRHADDAWESPPAEVAAARPRDSEAERHLFDLYRQLRERRERRRVTVPWLRQCHRALQRDHPDEWLIRLELLELPLPSTLQRALTTELRALQRLSPDHRRLIGYGLGLRMAA